MSALKVGFALEDVNAISLELSNRRSIITVTLCPHGGEEQWGRNRDKGKGDSYRTRHGITGEKSLHRDNKENAQSQDLGTLPHTKGIISWDAETCRYANETKSIGETELEK